MFLPLEWFLHLEASQHSLQRVKVEVQNCAFFVILVLLLLNVGGCRGQYPSSKTILKLKTQMLRPKEHAQIMFLILMDCFLSEIAVYFRPICPG